MGGGGAELDEVRLLVSYRYVGIVVTGLVQGGGSKGGGGAAHLVVGPLVQRRGRAALVGEILGLEQEDHLGHFGAMFLCCLEMGHLELSHAEEVRLGRSRLDPRRLESGHLDLELVELGPL